MASGFSLKTAFLVACLAVLPACADQKSMQAQVDDLKFQLAQLQKETKAAATTANRATADSSVTAMQKTIRQVQAENQSNAKAIADLSEKIDRMFKRPLAKQAADH